MTESLPTVLGFVELLVYFVFDLVYTNSLKVHKQAHPELEECAPHGSPDVDPNAVLDSLAATAVSLYRHQRARMSSETGAAEYSALDLATPEPAVAAVELPAESEPWYARHPIHTVVVLCSLFAPLLTVLVLLMPHLFAWTRLSVPLWLSYLFVVPGLAATGLYVLRATSLSALSEVTKTQWMAMMWFKLDFMFILAAVALLGLGLWVVALCMGSVAAYLAHRVMGMERRLQRVQKQTQLVRGEVDVSRVLVPGSAESRRALRESDGYSAVAAEASGAAV